MGSFGTRRKFFEHTYKALAGCTLAQAPPFQLAAAHVPHLLIRYDEDRVKIAPREVARQLRMGTPSIELNPATGSTEGSAGIPKDPNKIVVGVWMLEQGEDLIVGRRLRDSPGEGRK